MFNQSSRFYILAKPTLLTAVTVLFIGSGCSTNADKSMTTDSGQTHSDSSTAADGSGATRPVGEAPENWTDTPANQTPPDLSSKTSTGTQYCAQDKDYIYGDEAGCLFSIENFDKGEIQSLECDKHQAYLNGKPITDLSIGNLKIACP